nr:MAG TPA: nucleoid-associated protein [Caudoviricetes sp.]
MEVIQKLSDYFRVSMKYFLEPEATEAAIIRDELILSEHEKELIKKYRLLSPAGKKEVDHYLDFRLSAEAPRVEKDAEISSS